MGTREAYEEKLRTENLDRDPTLNPGLCSPRCPRFPPFPIGSALRLMQIDNRVFEGLCELTAGFMRNGMTMAQSRVYEEAQQERNVLDGIKGKAFCG
ncbi:hypothetical protein VNO80_03584 [Phaseolus coccineus]|uniref:Uncharacterized protein n=1 Tax=Phaseolus coccineus TaxID=3886 RepID=A0AAN9NSJ7_PHACN